MANTVLNKTEYAKKRGYNGKDKVIVVAGRVTTHNNIPWIDFCDKKLNKNESA